MAVYKAQPPKQWIRMLVSRRWWSLILARTLLHDVSIHSRARAQHARAAWSVAVHATVTDF